MLRSDHDIAFLDAHRRALLSSTALLLSLAAGPSVAHATSGKQITRGALLMAAGGLLLVLGPGGWVAVLAYGVGVAGAGTAGWGAGTIVQRNTGGATPSGPSTPTAPQGPVSVPRAP